MAVKKTAKSELRSVRIQAYPIDALKQAGWNPKTIDPKRFENLKDSIDADPDMMWERPVLAMADGTIYAGNQRWAACKELGWEEIPAIVEDVSEELARERALKDNRQWGEWNDETLGAMLAGMPKETSNALGFSDAQLAALMRQAPTPVPIEPDMDEEATYVQNEGKPGKTPTQMVEAWTAGETRMVVLYYQPEGYERVSGILEALRASFDVESNADAVLKVLEEYHADHCAGSEATQPE